MHGRFKFDCANYLSRLLLIPIVRCCRSLPSSVINEATGMLNVTAFLQLLNTLPDGQRRQLFSQLGVADETGLIAKFDPALSGVEDSLERQLMQYDEYKLHKLLLLYVPPILLIVGTIGNLFSFVVLMMPPMRRVSTYLYVAALSVTDTLVLLVGLLRLWVAELQGYDIQDIAEWTCKTINVLGYTVSDYSVWLIIAMTVERYVAVCHPLKAAAFCSRTRAVKVSMSMQPWSLHPRRRTCIYTHTCIYTFMYIYTRALPQTVLFVLGGCIMSVLLFPCSLSPLMGRNLFSSWPPIVVAQVGHGYHRIFLRLVCTHCSLITYSVKSLQLLLSFADVLILQSFQIFLNAVLCIRVLGLPRFHFLPPSGICSL